MSVKQFNVRYSPHDDRVIFRFNTVDQSEYILWLTRRVTHIILKTAGKFYEKEFDAHVPTVDKVISEVNQPDKQQTNFTQAYQSGVQYPIGGDAVLVMDAKCEMLKMNGQDICSLDFMLPGGANLNIKLTVPVMKGLVMLLEELNVKARWGSVSNRLH